MTEIVTASDARLGELAEIANREHEAVLVALGTAVHRGIVVGEALIEARGRVIDLGELWEVWAETNLRFTRSMANRYIKLANHKHALPPAAFEPFVSDRGFIHQPSVTSALLYVRGLPYPEGTRRSGGIPKATKMEVARLRGEGVTMPNIAELLGINLSSVWRILSPDRAKAYDRKQLEARRRREAGLKLLREQESARQVKAAAATVGGPAADAYSLIRRTAQRVDEARTAADTPEARAYYDAALKHIYRAEDAISKALRGAAKEEAA